MKTTSIYFSLLGFILLATLGCECPNAGFAIADLGENRTTILDTHNPECSVILERTCYNTKMGTATLCIPVPKGHALKLVKQKGNVIHFESCGNSVSEENDIFNIKLTNLSRKEGDSLFVFLWEKTNSAGCNSDDETKFSDKKKGTEITGQPFGPCADDGSTGSNGQCIEYQS